jgi:hypothetical protein
MSGFLIVLKSKSILSELKTLIKTLVKSSMS